MPLHIKSRLRFSLDSPADVLVQFEAAQLPEQRLVKSQTIFPDHAHVARIPAHDTVGDRVWLHAQGECEITHEAVVAIDRLTPDLAPLKQMELHNLPGTAVPYLFGSRYCQAEQFTDFVNQEFAGTAGGARIAAILDWCGKNLEYALGSSTASTTAIDTFQQGAGVCRDYAHLAIALARSSAIPARYASVYAPDVQPQDFHAIAEVFLADPSGIGGFWLPIDATGMARPEEMAKIGIGRDAADVSFLTAFGPCDFLENQVQVTRID